MSNILSTVIDTDLPPIRFRFFGEAHDRPITGHLYLRMVGMPAKNWKLSEWLRSSGERIATEGADPRDGGSAFVVAISDFLYGFHKEQQKAIDMRFEWIKKYRPSDMLNRKGFRPVSAGTFWGQSRGQFAEENRLIQADIDAAFLILRQGWSDAATPKVESLRFLEPWT